METYASNERQTLTCHRVLRGGSAVPSVVHVSRMDLLKERAPKPLGLQLVQNGSDRVRHVDNTTRLSRHHEQEAVSRLQNQVLQFLWPQTEGFKWCFKDFQRDFTKSTFCFVLFCQGLLHMAYLPRKAWHQKKYDKKTYFGLHRPVYIKIQNKLHVCFFLSIVFATSGFYNSYSMT